MAKILTYNLWHGLSPEGVIRFRAMEPKSRKRLRYKLQKQMLTQLSDCDFCFLQEANPVGKRSQELAEWTQMQSLYCRDNSGIKWGPWGLPQNLDSGLCTLYSDQQYLESHKVLRLSDDGRSFLHNKASFQLSEGRSALLVSTFSNESGRSLWVNTHLHHGIELTEGVKEQIKELRKTGAISEGVEEELLQRLLAADQRRLREVDVLLAELESVKGRYNLIVLAGDLNATPGSAVLEKFSDFGFKILESKAEGEITWNPELNDANHILSRDYIPALLLEDLSFDKKIVSHLEGLARGWESRPRKIDYILGWSQTGSIQVQSSQLIGLPDDSEMAPSDHFGVVTEFSWSANP